MQDKTNLKTRDKECLRAVVVAAKSAKAPIKVSASRLTGAENRVLAQVTLAKTNKEIAHDLGISPATVKRHLENVLSKLGVRNRVEAAIYGIFINGCFGGSNNGCALETWCKERQVIERKWAD